MRSDIEEICSFVDSLLERIEHRGIQNKAFSMVENIIGRTIPDSVKVMLDENGNMHDIFGAWVFSTPTELGLDYSEMCSPPFNNPSFFNGLEVSPEFELPAGRPLVYESSQAFPGRYEIGDKVTNLKAFIPIANASHATLLLNTDAHGELLGCHYGASFYVYAPNVEEHLLDVVDGVCSGRYPIEDGYIGIGDTWLERMESKHDNLSFDIDGELQR